VLNALLFGLAASSALVIRGVVGAYWKPPDWLVATAIAFASGALITALATDLFAEPLRTGGILLAGIGLLAGAAVFVLADTLLDRHIEGAGSSVSGYVILAAVILDGIPENAALGISLQTSGTEALALLVGVFASNLPEALGGAVSMKDQGRTSGFAIVVWTVTAVVLAAAVVAGNAVLSGVSEESITILLAFAGGAVLASLADTLMPDAYREGGKPVAFATAAGFFVSFVISEL
jgi:ZIP family zinc transporter